MVSGCISSTIDTWVKGLVVCWGEHVWLFNENQLYDATTKGLTHLMNKAEHESGIKGIQFWVQGPPIHHLLFADDSMFIYKVCKQRCDRMQGILEKYGSLTG